MKFLLDEDVYSSTARLLTDEGHDSVTAVRAGYAEIPDDELVALAAGQDRILVTRDRDFGSLVFLENLNVGVIYMRMLPSTVNAVHEELQRVLRTYSEQSLRQAFVVIEPGRHRFRRL